MNTSTRAEISAQAQTAFEAGNYFRVRQLVKILKENGHVEEAAGFQTKIAIDPAQFLFFGICLVFLVGAVWSYAL